MNKTADAAAHADVLHDVTFRRLWALKSGECLFKIEPGSSAALTHMDVALDMSTIIVADANSVV